VYEASHSVCAGVIWASMTPKCRASPIGPPQRDLVIVTMTGRGVYEASAWCLLGVRGFFFVEKRRRLNTRALFPLFY
jgi:hypothetical protein